MTPKERDDIQAKVARGEFVSAVDRVAAGCPEHIPYPNHPGEPLRRI
jgi:hypothetical protein